MVYFTHEGDVVVLLLCGDDKVNRESLYKSLDGKTKVSFETIYKILDNLWL